MAGGVSAGLLGAADALLLPVLGPTEATNVVSTGVPVAELALARIEGEEETKAQPSTEAMTTEPMTRANEEVDTASEKYRREFDEGADAATGAVLGGFLGVAAALLIPGIGPVGAGGLLLTALAGAAIGAVAGSVLGAFVSMGVSEQAAHWYAREFEVGRTIVTLKTASRQQAALEVVPRKGALEGQVH